jgi:hypothetical protein
MERRRTIFLFNHDDIDGSAESSGIDRVPCLGHGAGDGSHVLHPLGGIAMTTRWIERMAWVEDVVPGEATFCCVSPTSGQETDNNLVCMNKVLGGYGGKEVRSSYHQLPHRNGPWDLEADAADLASTQPQPTRNAATSHQARIISTPIYFGCNL